MTLPRRARSARRPRRCASCGRGSSAASRDAAARARRDRARARARCPTSAATLRLVEQPGRTRAHRRGDVLLVPARDPISARRSSAGTGARRAPRSSRGSTRPSRRVGSGLHAADDPRPAHALGVVLDDGRDGVQLAAAARPRGGPRLRRLARGLPPRGDGPLAALLGAARAARARATREPRAGCAAARRRSRCERAAAGRRRRPHRVDPVRGRAARCPRRARSSTRAQPSRSPRAAARSPRRTSRSSPGRRRSSPPSATTTTARASCDELVARGVTLHAAVRPARRRAAASPTSTTTTSARSRCSTRGSSRTRPTICPGTLLAGLDAVYFTGGDAGALRAARAARVLVATPRALDVIAESGVQLDVLVSSASDPGEQVAAGALDPAPRLVVRTGGAAGGSWSTRRRRRRASGRAEPLPGPARRLLRLR